MPNGKEFHRKCAIDNTLTQWMWSIFSIFQNSSQPCNYIGWLAILINTFVVDFGNRPTEKKTNSISLLISKQNTSTREMRLNLHVFKLTLTAFSAERSFLNSVSTLFRLYRAYFVQLFDVNQTSFIFRHRNQITHAHTIIVLMVFSLTLPKKKCIYLKSKISR